jgi:4-hydroxy-tetrahydrodipicolinate synthase
LTTGEAAELRGSLTPVVTPFRNGDVDLDAFGHLVERQVAEGSHGVVITGTTGEPTSLSQEERATLFGAAVTAAAGRVPVVAATGASNHEETLELTRSAEAAGVDAVLVVVPAFVRPSQRGLLEHFRRVFGATDLPAMIYHIPGRSAAGVTVETVQSIAEAAPNLIGLKSASPDLDLVTSLLLALGDDFKVFCGVESLTYPMLAVGAAGVMSAVANLEPNRVADLCEAVAEGDHPRALVRHRELFEVNRAVFFDTNPVPLKAMLAARGIASEEVRPPLAPLDQRTRARVMAALESLDRSPTVTA